ncbi:hypothetical protein ABQ366_01870 [Serratia fonticola]|uniref:hypothetical protein n=1 Tax=Serratia fonticola TaxID=47917 RepID=UPI003AABAA5B|nr:hypothetical protein [Serratia fonticola]
MSELFQSPEVQKHFKKCLENLELITTNGDFEKKRNSFIKDILTSIINHPKTWDDSTAFNTEQIFDDLLRQSIQSDSGKEELDGIFVTLFRFYIEMTIVSRERRLRGVHRDIIKFINENLHEFHGINNSQLLYALNHMSRDVIQLLVSSDDMKIIRQLVQNTKNEEDYYNNWLTQFNNRKAELQALDDKLQEYKNEYNFVGLSEGYVQLSQDKSKQRNRTLIAMGLVSILIFIVIGFEMYLLHDISKEATTLQIIAPTIPMVTLLFILLYFFRISLFEFKSLSSQINQIELRKTLCQFIQNYADYSAEIKTKNGIALVKFEEIIFSNILTKDDPMPSTFDGIEHIAAILKPNNS